MYSNYVIYEQSNFCVPQKPSKPSLTIYETMDNTAELPSDVAVHAHIYYSELASEIRTYLSNIPVEFHFYVTTNTQEKASAVKSVFSDLKNLKTMDIRIVENRGRDLAPMIVVLGKELSKHEIVLHIHTKRSPHRLDLQGWRRYLMTSLLGNSTLVSTILYQFAQNDQLGILYPQVYYPVIASMGLGDNLASMEALLIRAGFDSRDIRAINHADFPAGSMFWFRGKILDPFVHMRLSIEDFDVETGQYDGTLAHAIERVWPYFANKIGFEWQSYIPKAFSGSCLGAMSLDVFKDFCFRRVIDNSIIIFDHNIGGGANCYSRELMKTTIAGGNSVLRLYYDANGWLIEWVRIEDGLTFISTSVEDLFEALSNLACKEIIINSLFGYPDVIHFINRVVRLGRLLNATIDYKVHDYYAICPSQHLLNCNERYCNVTSSSESDCNRCLKKNSAAYWVGEYRIGIKEWRDAFCKLFTSADVINVFDVSTIEILKKVLVFDENKIRCTPHSDDYFIFNGSIPLSLSLHIGVLGTLTTVKGAAVVNTLSQYIKEQGEEIPITVVGRSLVPTIPAIKVLGPYENNTLPEIIIKNGINVILMPTIVPETFSYTISEAIKMKLPIVAFDIGAQGQRVKQYDLGKVVPIGSSPKVILTAIQSVLRIGQGFKI